MKKFTFLCIFFLFTTAIIAQVPPGISYQAVVRNTSGDIVASKAVKFRFSILRNTETGTSVYVETQSVTTNDFGLANLNIGRGTVVDGIFSPGGWGLASHFLKIELDVAGGSNYTHLGTLELMAVPYAFHAQTVEEDHVDDADADATNELQELELSGTVLGLSKSSKTVILPSSGGGDNWGTQVVQTDTTLTGKGTDASPLGVVQTAVTPEWDNIQGMPEGFADGVDDAGDADSDTLNEIQTLLLTGTQLTLSKEGGTVTLPSSGSGGDNWGSDYVHTDATLEGQGTTSLPLKIAQQSATTGQLLKWDGSSWTPAADDDADDDSDAANELQDLSVEGNTLKLSESTATVDLSSYLDNTDSQTLSITENNLSISGGNTVTLPSSGGGDNWGTDVVHTDATLEGQGTTALPLKIAQQSATTGQVLKWNGSNWLPENDNSGSSYWQQSGNDIYFDTGKVGIGTSPGTDLRQFQVQTGHKLAVVAINSSDTYAALYAENNGTGPAADFRNKIRIFDGTHGAGKVLTSDSEGYTSWETPSGGGLTLPYSGSDELASDPIFTITNTGNGNGIKGRSGATSGVYYGVIGESASQNGTGVYGSAPYIGVEGIAQAPDGIAINGYAYDAEGENYGIKGVTNSSTGYSGYFQGGRFYISGNTGIGVTNPAAKLDIDGQLKIRGGSPGAGKVLTSDAAGLASWETSGALTFPFRGGSPCEECEVFYIHNTERGTAIKGDSYLGDGIVGVTRGTGSYRGVLGYATNSSGVSIGVKGKTNSPTGYSGYFEGGRFYVSGNVGIGNNSPVNALSVSGQADISGGLVVGGTTLAGKLLVANADGAGNSFKVGSSAGDNANIYFLADGLIFDCYRASDGRRQPILFQPNGGRVGIGTKTPTQVLHVVGNAYKTEGGTAWATSSDLRLKTILGNYDKGLKEIAALQPVRFIYNEGNDRKLSSDNEQVGLIAQEVQKIFPEAVTEAEDGYLDFNIHAINIALVNAVKELKAENNWLKAENKKLKARDIQIESRLEILEQLFGASTQK